MSKAAKSLFVFAIYLIVVGLGFLVIPNVPLRLLGFATTDQPWIRVVGMLLLLVAYYYIQVARNEVETVFRWTVHARSSVIVFFAVFVALGLAKPMLILFGVIDLLAAAWTYTALRASEG